MFSGRVPGDLRPNALARLRGERARVPFDLTVSNPTLCGIEYPLDLLAPLGDAAGLAYLPDPVGIEPAREAIAEEYRRRGIEIDPERIVLTASTSEAYALLFKLLCDAGNAVAVPAPSYPLFEHLATLDCVRAVPYRLERGSGWQPDLDELAGEAPRAVVAVHPNNPTGSYLDRRSADALVRYCSQNGAALIVDEVFHGYPLPPAAPAPSFAGRDETLTFTLDGISKSLALPQLKLAWIVAGGPPALVEDARERLAFIADQYLSVATPVQLSLRHLFRDGAAVRDRITHRSVSNLASLESAVGDAEGIALVRPQGGWTAVLGFPRVVADEALALELLDVDGVAVHPGYFFDFAEEGYLSLSLLPEPEIFREGVRRILARIAAHL